MSDATRRYSPKDRGSLIAVEVRKNVKVHDRS